MEQKESRAHRVPDSQRIELNVHDLLHDQRTRRPIITREVFPEIQPATQALEQRITATEVEISQLKKSLTAKRRLVKWWRKAIQAVNPKPAGQKEKAASQ